MAINDIALLRRAKALARQDYDKQVLGEAGAGSADYGDAGPPNWNPSSWEAFRAQYGRYPYSASELPPSFAGAPDWVYEKLGLRKPPVTVSPGY